MVDAWGPWIDHGNGNGTRLGYRQWATDINADLAAVHVTVYLQTRYALYDSSATLSVTGTPSGSHTFSFSHGSAGGTTELATFSANVQKQFGSAVVGSWSASVSGIDSVPGSPSVGASWSLPAKPYLPPRIVPWASVTRVSDSTQRLQWGHDMDPATGAQPVHAFNIYRSTNGGAAQLVASVAASVSSWDDKTTSANNLYTYTIYAFNSAGASPGRVVGSIVTTPAAPVIGAVAKAGSNITVGFTDRSTVEASHDVQHDFGAGTEVLPGPGGSTTTGERTWTHASPSTSQTHRYRVRARNGAGVSAWSAWSATVQLQAPPLAPTILAPTDPQDVGTPTQISWRHNPADASPQRQYRVAYRAQGTTTWAYTPITESALQRHSFPVGTFTTGAWEFLVQTWGDHANPSPYSSAWVVAFSSRPRVTITSPSGVVTSNRATVRWAFNDPDGGEQTAWQVRLYRDQAEVASASGAGGDSSWETPVLENGASYAVSVSGQDPDGLWSSTTIEVFSVAYAAPPRPDLVSVWDEANASVTLTALVAAGDPAAAEVEVWRAADPATIAAAHAYLAGEPGAEYALEAAFTGGASLVGRVLPDGAIIDHIPTLASPNVYRAVSVSQIGATATGPWHIVETTAARGFVFLNAGPGFGQMVRLRDNVEVEATPTRVKKHLEFAGRDGVVEYSTPRRAKGRTISFTVSPWSEGSTMREIEDFILTAPAPVCYRDATGALAGPVRDFVSLTGEFSHSYSGVTASGSIAMQQVRHVG